MKTLLILFSVLFSMKSYALIGGLDVSEIDILSKSVIALQMVEKQSDGTVNRYKGSGVLVTPNVILTAAHNFFYLDDVTASEAIFSTTPMWGENSQAQKRIFVEKVLIFPDFSQGQLGTINDMALVFLKESAPSEYRPLKIELEGNAPPVLFEKGILLGYGKSNESPGRPLSDFRLRKLELNFARWDNSTIYNSQKIWFSNKNGSIAGGDSGGPVLFQRNNEYIVYGVGIHKRYDDCVEQNICEDQSAYSNTNYFSDWIKKNLNLE
jgi:secreted trypsin-like serine protease